MHLTILCLLGRIYFKNRSVRKVLDGKTAHRKNRTICIVKPPKPDGFGGNSGCGGRTRTYDLRVMSPTSFQLLYSAILLRSSECLCIIAWLDDFVNTFLNRILLVQNFRIRQRRPPCGCLPFWQAPDDSQPNARIRKAMDRRIDPCTAWRSKGCGAGTRSVNCTTVLILYQALGQNGQQFLYPDGLCDMPVHAHAERVSPVFFECVGGHGDDRNTCLDRG